ncbi:putative F-box protein At2g36090 [Nicotiana tabacum]|uniref:F-box protein At2g36090 n=2 Tax=Nicotiana TaxID=4085 RepID=A0A1S4ABW2_TOBAC|nr:PREDICTED: probable F-box protein At1g60180 [Nicotiana sylvestris]XP_016474096.1 PREDICTED: probable F-box protein At1g60180 [Nicotiana tabacum]
MTSSPNYPLITSITMVTAEKGGAAEFSDLHPDIIEDHILPRLDGPTLASTSCSSTTLHHLCSDNHLWSRICHSTWPSTATPRVSHVISTFPDSGHRTFFAQSFSLPLSDDKQIHDLESVDLKRVLHAININPYHLFCICTYDPSRKQWIQLSSSVYAREMNSVASSNIINCSSPPLELISAVDIHYKEKVVFSKVQETETTTSWFQCWPFRIDMIDPKDVILTTIKHPNDDDTCTDLIEDMTLSWILINPIGRRAINLSSFKPVSVQRHWLTGEVQVRFTSILTDDQKRGHVQCEIVVTCGGSEVGEMEVREVSLEVEDMDGTHLNGRESLVILQRALEGKRGNGANRAEIGRKRYKEFLEMRRERKERKLKREGALDILCVAFGIFIFVAFWCFLFCLGR